MGKPVKPKAVKTQKPTFRLKKLQNEKFAIYFGSGIVEKEAKMMSNFALVKKGILFRGLVFDSTEAAFQALRTCTPARLARGGDLSTFEGFHKFLTPEKAQKTSNHWGKCKDPVLQGIVSKMVRHEDRASKAGLELKPKVYMAPEELESVWQELLTTKAQASPEFKAALLATGDHHLVEFDRHVESDWKKHNKKAFWTGAVDKETGELYGTNYMGEMLMQLRGKLQKTEEEEQKQAMQERVAEKD